MGDLTAQLAEQVQFAYATKTPLNICAGNTKTGLGRSTGILAEDDTIDVAAHAGIISYDPTELVIRARAGTKLVELQDALSQEQQRLPFEPPNFGGAATIGGTVAANQSGPSRPWFGGVKDSLLGLGLINGYGEDMQFGGQVMKNVAGFDITRLQCGAMGSLGLITDLSIKVLPQFKRSQTLAFETSLASALENMQQWANLSLPITGMSYWQGQFYVRLQGTESGVAAAMAQLGGESITDKIADVFWQSVASTSMFEPNSDQILWRWSGPRDEPISTAISHHADSVMFNWAGAERWFSLPDTADNREVLPQVNGMVQYRGGDRLGEVNGDLNVAETALQRRIKCAFDPHGIFNAGRLYSWM